MPQSAQKGARSRLADVLADIKNSRSVSLAPNNSSSNNNVNSAPTPAKRRSAVNYVALSGHTPRQSRSSTSSSTPAATTTISSTTTSTNNGNNISSSPQQARQNNSDNDTKNSTNHCGQTTNRIASKNRTYILRLFDRSIDLAPFLTSDAQDECTSLGELGSLYTVCRSWLQDQKQLDARNNENLKETYHNEQREQQHSSDQTMKSDEDDESCNEREAVSQDQDPQQLEIDEMSDLRLKLATRTKKSREKIEQVVNRLNININRSIVLHDDIMNQ